MRLHRRESDSKPGEGIYIDRLVGTDGIVDMGTNKIATIMRAGL